MKGAKAAWAALLIFLYAGPVHAQDGRALYDMHCASCHQADGGGVPFINPPLVDSFIVSGDGELLARWVLLGNDAADADYESEFSGLMPGFAHLSDAEVAAILKYIRYEFATGLKPITLEEVKQARDTL